MYCSVRCIAVFVAACAVTGCSGLGESMISLSPEEVAERERQATLPISEADCRELERRAEAASRTRNDVVSTAILREVGQRCWSALAISMASCREIERRASSQVLRGLTDALYRAGGTAEPGTIGEAASQAVDTMAEELRRRC